MLRTAPPPHIERITTPQERYLGRVQDTVSALLAACRDSRGATTARLLEARWSDLRHRLSRSPYYREVLAAHGLAPRDLLSASDLAFFPTLDRATLQQRWADVPIVDPDDPETLRLVRVTSSGSTGMPVTIFKDGFDAVYMWAALQFWCAWYQVALPNRPRAVMLCSLPGGLEYSVRLPLLHRGALHRLSILRGDAEARLRRSRADVLLGDPAGLHWLASINAPPRPLLVLSSAQHLSPFARARAADATGSRIINYYSTTETTQVAWECEQRLGSFHVLVPDYWVESVDGELVVTRLRSGLVPLLRYRTGDRGEVVPDECECGYRGWTIRELDGRRACCFVRPDGTRADAWQLAWIFKHTQLRDFVVTQAGASRFEVRIAGTRAGRQERDALRQRLADSLSNMGWTSPEVEMLTVDRIDGRGDKPEPFRVKLR